jgi:transcriptional accessory protein Tex/SPT6
MDIKQMDFETNFNKKLPIDHNLVKRLLFFVHNLEEKLLSVKTVHEKLYKLLSIVANTHQNILEELITIKTVVNEIDIEQFQDEDEFVLYLLF